MVNPGQNVIYFQGGRDEAKAVVQSFIRTLTGSGSSGASDRQLAEGVFYSIGFAALSDIQADFIRKARGGVGEDGTSWPPLKPETIAYSRRFGPGEQAGTEEGCGTRFRKSSRHWGKRWIAYQAATEAMEKAIRRCSQVACPS